MRLSENFQLKKGYCLSFLFSPKGVKRLERAKIFDFEIKEILQSLPQQKIDWGTKLIGADKAWQKYRGKGMKIGVIDSGIDYTHPDIGPNVKETVSFIDGSDGFDNENGHGTLVAGVIAGCDNGIGTVGVAPESEIYSAKVFDKDGKTNTNAIFSAFRWMIEKGVHVINMSFGGIYPADIPGVAEFLEEYHSRIKELHDAGIIMVAATGNSGNTKDTLDRVSWPARFPEVLAAGAISQELQRAEFSSTGPALDFAMPGVDVYSCYPNKQWARFSGTSIASPYLSGCVALIQEYALKTTGRLFTFDEAKQNLIDFSMDLGVEGADVEFGWGLVNIGKIGIAAMKEITIDIDQPMIIDKNTWRTLAPVRFLVEINGGHILDWDDDTKTVKFKTFDGKEVTMQADSHKVVIKSKRW